MMVASVVEHDDHATPRGSVTRQLLEKLFERFGIEDLAHAPNELAGTQIDRTETGNGFACRRASVVKCLKVWREDSPYRGDEDFIFPSIRRNGKQPLSPDTLLKKIIRPAVERAGIKGKAIGWHSFRHSLATNLRAAGVDLKTAQELLRHANSRITLDVYTRAISATKREANNRVMTMVLEAGKKQALSAPSKGAKAETKKVRIAPAPSSAPSKEDLDFATCHKPFVFLGFMAGTTGLEPATSAVTTAEVTDRSGALQAMDRCQANLTANAIIALRCSKLSGRFEDFWGSRANQAKVAA
jgi:hypothetical protein